MKLDLPKILALSLVLTAPLQADPLINSWFTGNTGQYARLYENTATESAGPGAAVTTWDRGQGTQAQPTYAGVHEVSYTETDVYVRSTGLGGHIMGPWYLNAAQTNLFPNYPANQAVIYRIPRDPGTVPTTKTPTGGGRIGMFVDGVSMFDSRDAFSYINATGSDGSPMGGSRGDGVWNRDAYVNESVTFDAANAHQAGAQYHYHANPTALRHFLGDSVDHDASANTYTENFNGAHSPIIGWVGDGYPVYGPYGYMDPLDPASAIVRMRSGFQKRNITVRQTLPAVAARNQGYTPAGSTTEFTLAPNEYGPPVTAGAGSQYELGHYLEDYEYLGDLGQTLGADFDLDEHNGRFCVTPEFPEGTYAYFACIESDGTPKFPYNIGRTYYGTPSADEENAIPVEATTAFEGGPEKQIENESIEFDPGNGEVTVTWSAIQGGTYVAQQSEDLQEWETLPDAALDGDKLSAVDTDGSERKFYRTKLLDIAPFDDNGFDVQDTPAQVSNAGHNIMLIIVDDWGIDSSPVDNPGAARHASMPTLQWLADNGLRFTNAYAQAQCSPTRASMLTGRYAFRHGIGTPAGATLPADEFTLPEAFAAADSNYAVASFGKWHLGGGVTGPETLGGWSEFRGALSNLNDYWDWNKTINGTTTPVTNTYATSDQVDDAIAFVNAQGTTPWFSWLAFHAPHGPFHDPDPSLLPSGATGTTTRDLYEKALEAMDTEIFRLLQSVDLSKTNIILIGDNGTPANVAQAPFGPGNAKATLYEGGLHVPMIAFGPDVPAGGANDSLVHCADVYSTVLALAEIDVDSVATNMLDSRNLLPAFCGAELDGCVVLESFGNQQDDPGRAIRIGDYKLIIFDDPEITTDTPRLEFYNVVTDPGETMNLAADGIDANEQPFYDVLIDKNTALSGGFGDTGNGGGGDPVSTGILDLAPDSGTPGNTITVTFNLDQNVTMPGIPPLNNMAGNPITPTLTIGNVTGTNVNRPSRYVATATFTLPAAAGFYDAQIIFPGPNTPTFDRTFAFEVAP